MIGAKVIADSVSPLGHRLTTMELRFHRFILAEFNTHRAFSRNSASSRARSTKKTIKEVNDNPARPVMWLTERRGMSGTPLASDNTLTFSMDGQWYAASDHAAAIARNLAALGTHKSIVNRLLEPFMWHTVVVTATDWDNFFEQRLALLEDGTPASQPEMYELARQMRDALDGSEPTKLDIGDWHTPYVTARDIDIVAAETTPFSITRLCQISVARCAGVSYLTQDAEGRDHVKDVALFERLRNAEPPHWSPFEHVATPLTLDPHGSGYSDNFHGWRSYRNLLTDYDR